MPLLKTRNLCVWKNTIITNNGNMGKIMFAFIYGGGKMLYPFPCGQLQIGRIHVTWWDFIFLYSAETPFWLNRKLGQWFPQYAPLVRRGSKIDLKAPHLLIPKPPTPPLFFKLIAKNNDKSISHNQSWHKQTAAQPQIVESL